LGVVTLVAALILGQMVAAMAIDATGAPHALPPPGWSPRAFSCRASNPSSVPAPRPARARPRTEAVHPPARSRA
jgi:hypothetical protein